MRPGEKLPVNREPVTPELASRVNLIFFPKTQEESALLQKALFNQGFIWSTGSKAVASDPNILSEGLVLLEGKMFWRGKNDDRVYRIATLAQALTGYSPSPQEQFTALGARLDALEKMVAEIHDAVAPKEIDKPALKRPGKQAQP
jgi:hypothetical protein